MCSVNSEFVLSDDKERLFVVSLSLKLKKITGSVGNNIAKLTVNKN